MTTKPRPQDNEPSVLKLYDVDETCAFLNCSRSLFFRLVREGHLPVVKIGGRLTRVRHLDLVAYLDRAAAGHPAA